MYLFQALYGVFLLPLFLASCYWVGEQVNFPSRTKPTATLNIGEEEANLF